MSWKKQLKAAAGAPQGDDVQVEYYPDGFPTHFTGGYKPLASSN